MIRVPAAPHAAPPAPPLDHAEVEGRFRRWIHRATSGLALTALFVLLSTGEIGVGPAAAIGGGLALILLRRAAARALVESVGATPLALAAFVACGALGWSGRMFEAVITFVAALLLLRVAAPERPRDLVQAITLSFILVAGASALTESVEFALPFLAYVGMLVVAATITTAYRAFLRAHPAAGLAGGRLPTSPRGLRRHWAATWVVLVATAIFLFLLIPRFSAPALWLAALRAEQQASGYEEEVKFGTITNISLDHTPVMRVTVTSGPDLGHVRLRGTALDRFEGGTWRRTTEFHRVQLVQMYDELPEQSMIGFAEDLGRRTGGEYLVEIERNTTNTVFVPYVATHFPYRDGDSQPQLQYDFAAGAVRVISVDLVPKLVYRVGWSYLGDPSEYPRLLASTRVPLVRRAGHADRTFHTRYGELIATQRERNLVLPDRLRASERLRALALEMAAGATERVEIARRVERALHAGYAYSLQSRVEDPDAIVEEFLFSTRAGHCEHFATAMTMLLRALGIPARLVNGFYSDEFNPVAGGYIVRESNAHSWVEVFFDEVGWLPFDPTPPEGRGSRKDGSSLFRRWLSHLYDSARAMWYRNVIDFSILRQRRLFGRLFALFDRDMEDANTLLLLRPLGSAGAAGSRAALGVLGLAAMVVVIAAWLLARALRRISARRPARGGAAALAPAPASPFAAMLRRETQRRLRPEADVNALTPRELLGLWAAAGADAAVLGRAARQFEAWRYAAAAPVPRPPHLRALTREVRAALRALPLPRRRRPR